MNKKKVGIIIAAAAVAVVAAVVAVWFVFKGSGTNKSSADKVYVESVKALNAANLGAQNRYSGVVEPQETWEVNKNAEKTVKNVLVSEGDSVETGTPLFEYDTEALKGELAQAELELEGINNEISNYQTQIKQLNEEKKAASQEEKFQYTSQIQSLQNSIKQSEFNIESKKIEMKKKQESIDNSTVTSQLTGVVKTINESGMDPITGQSAAYMTVLATGDYRIKGTISEQNVFMISEGQSVIIRSRIDENQTWKGTVSKIDTENQETGNNNNGMMMGSGDSGAQTSAKYPFYITLESVEGLILGQHIYIEMNEGQTEKKEGLWLSEGYIVKEEKEAYVWAEKKNKLEKRKIELGEYDEALGQYEIKSGITEKDFIAFPMEGLYEGVTTVKDAAEVDTTSPLYNQQGGDGTPAEGGEMPIDGSEVPIEGGEVPIEGGEMPIEGQEMPVDGEEIDMGGSESIPESGNGQGTAEPAQQPEG